MRQYTRFIPGEEIGAVTQWRFGDVELAGERLQHQNAAPEVESEAEAFLSAQRQQAHDAGYAEGYTQGHAQGLLQAQRQINDYQNQQGRETAQQLATVVETARAQLDNGEQLAAQAVLDIAVELARQVLRHEIAGNPNALLPVIREALGQLFADSRAVQIRMHPLDLDVLQDAVREEFPNLPLTLQGDAAITRGGCMVEAGGTVVDGRLEKRWLNAISRLGHNGAWEEVTGDDAN